MTPLRLVGLVEKEDGACGWLWTWDSERPPQGAAAEPRIWAGRSVLSRGGATPAFLPRARSSQVLRAVLRSARRTLGPAARVRTLSLPLCYQSGLAGEAGPAGHALCV